MGSAASSMRLLRVILVSSRKYGAFLCTWAGKMMGDELLPENPQLSGAKSL
jgi:hypothetical protein